MVPVSVLAITFKVQAVARCISAGLTNSKTSSIAQVFIVISRDRLLEYQSVTSTLLIMTKSLLLKVRRRYQQQLQTSETMPPAGDYCHT